MTEDLTKVPESTDSLDGAKDFLLQEYQSLYTLHQYTKEEGEKRLNFYVTFVAAVGSFLIAAQQFIKPELYVWLAVSTTTIVLSLGLITFRKTLQRRVATIAYRRRLNRIRAWFVRHYPSVSSGLAYGIGQDVQMDWGKNKMGSTALSVAFINSAVVFFGVVLLVILTFTLNTLWWAIPIAAISAIITWWLHLSWKEHWMKVHDLADQKDILALSKLSSESVRKPNLEKV